MGLLPIRFDGDLSAAYRDEGAPAHTLTNEAKHALGAM